MELKTLIKHIGKKQSFLCVGLDTDIQKIPKHLLKSEHPFFEFNKAIIDATHEYTIAYKPNLAFYECEGIEGWASLELTVNYIRENYPDIFLIADAKRGDIGNTAEMYAQTFFEHLGFDAVTLSPYMGSDSISPFLSRKGKFVILLALTSNKGARDFQLTQIAEDQTSRLFEKIIKTASTWGTVDNTMFVTGATQVKELKRIREIIPDHFLLIPGIGAQGGNLEEVAASCFNHHCGIIVNSSRAVIYADDSEQFHKAARNEVIKIQQKMQSLLKKYNICQ